MLRVIGYSYILGSLTKRRFFTQKLSIREALFIKAQRPSLNKKFEMSTSSTERISLNPLSSSPWLGLNNCFAHLSALFFSTGNYKNSTVYTYFCIFYFHFCTITFFAYACAVGLYDVIIFNFRWWVIVSLMMSERRNIVINHMFYLRVVL